MPASYRQNDRFRSLFRWRIQAVACLIVAVLTSLSATAAIAAVDPWSEPHVGYDPFEEVAPAAGTSTVTIKGESELCILPPAMASVGESVDGAQQFGRGLAKLASGEQLPGLAPTAAPDQANDAHWSPKPLSDMSINIRLPNGMLPRDYWAEHPQPPAICDTCGTNRGWPLDCYHWCPSCLCYQPLYFEEPNLERYGYGCGCYTCCCSTCIQSAASAAHFFGTVPMLPYMMAANCPCECNYALGDYRPGDCNPWRYQCCTPCSAAGACSESSAAYGMILLLP